MKKIIYVTCLLILFTFCKKKPNLYEEDYFSFGTYDGNGCFGENCFKLYVIADFNLYEDLDGFNDTKSDYVILSKEKYEFVRDIVYYIPDELFLEENQTFGYQNHFESEGIYIKYVLNGESGEYRFSNNSSSSFPIPVYANLFLDKINHYLCYIDC